MTNQTNHPYHTLIERLRAQFGSAIEPFLGALTGLLERTDLVSKADYQRAMDEIRNLRALVEALEARIDGGSEQPSPTAPDPSPQR